MRDPLTILARVLAGLLVVVFALGAAAALTLFVAGARLFDADLYKQALRRQDLYPRFPALAAEQLTYGDPVDRAVKVPDELASLSAADWELLLGELLPEGWVQAQMESALDQTFGTLDAEAPPPVTISLAEMKEQLAGEAGTRALLRVVHSWPPCSAPELLAWATLGGNAALDDLPRCAPPDEALALAAPVFADRARALAARLPEQADVAALSGQNGDPRPGLRRGRDAVQRWAWATMAAAMVLLLAIAALAVRSARAWLLWWGIALLLAGGLAGLGALTGGLLVNWALSLLVPARVTGNLTPAMLAIMTETARAVANDLALRVGAVAAAAGFLGLLGAAAGALVRPRRVVI